MGIDKDWYDEWTQKVKRLPVTMKNVLGSGWETDQENGWKDATWEIMRGENWEALVDLMENTVKMFKLLNDADNVFAKLTENESVEQTAVDCPLDKEATYCEESLADMESVSSASDSSSLRLRIQIYDQKLSDTESDDDESGSSAVNSYKEENTRPTDKRQNVIVFLPAEMDCSTQDKEIEKALTYLGCDKDNIVNTEMIRDRGEDCNGKVVLRVQMDTVKQASKALANAYKLKNYPVPGIYIAKDMTYHQRLKMRELVRTLRFKIEMLPKYRWKIVDWEVVNVGLFKKNEHESMKLALIDSSSASLVSSSGTG